MPGSGQACLKFDSSSCRHQVSTKVEPRLNFEPKRTLTVVSELNVPGLDPALPHGAVKSRFEPKQIDAAVSIVIYSAD